MKGKRQRWSPGAVVEVPLGEGYRSYAQMLDDGEYTFFDSRTQDVLTAEAVVLRPVLFRLWVMRYAHSKGHWMKVGEAPISPTLQQPVRRFNQDTIRPQDIRLTFDGCEGPLATIKDCEGLESAAVWDPRHVEDRLRSHYAGTPCLWTASLRPKSVAKLAVTPVSQKSGKT